MELLLTPQPLLQQNAVAAPVVLERDMEGLVEIAEPVAQKLQSDQLFFVCRRGGLEGRSVLFDRSEQALGRHGTIGGREVIRISRHDDEVMTGGLALPLLGTKVVRPDISVKSISLAGN